MKEWLLVNALVSFIFSIIILIPGIALLFNPESFIKNLEVFMNQSGASAIGLSNDEMKKVAMAELWFLIIFCFLLSIHIIWTYRLVKQNAGYFSDEA